MRFLFASIVSLRLWSLKVVQICFLMFSISLGVLFSAAKPSSLYNPTAFPNSGDNFDKR